MTGGRLRFSQDAAIVLGLAATALSFAHTREEEAECWLRLLRMHGRVGEALQALGVPEAPLVTHTHPAPSPGGEPLAGVDQVEAICRQAVRPADAGSTARVGTVDILFAVLATYEDEFDHALYVRGTSRAELLERLMSTADRAPLR